MNTPDIARIRILATELLDLADKLEGEPQVIPPVTVSGAPSENLTLLKEESLDAEDDAPLVAPYGAHTYTPVARRPSGLDLTSDIVLALEHVTTGVTATDAAKKVLAPGDRYSKAHYTATYAALTELQVYVEVEHIGNLWSLTPKGRGAAAEIREVMAKRKAWQAQRDQLEADEVESERKASAREGTSS
jgi:hypothetical protein